jgi:hypothetical protein
MAVKMRPTYCRTKRPRGALLQLGIGVYFGIVERRRDPDVKSGDNETPLFPRCIPNSSQLETLAGTVPGGQFDWGSPLLKSNARAQRSA